MTNRLQISLMTLGLILTLLVLVFALAITATEEADATTALIEPSREVAFEVDYCSHPDIDCGEGSSYQEFEVSAFNTVPEQTDSTPCISASGDNVCGRNDVVACPKRFPLGTKFTIDDKEYICLDRLPEKYDHRVDISFDKDIQGAINWGVQIKKVKINLWK